MYREIALTGGSEKHTSLQLSSQRTINLWPQIQPTGNEKSIYILESFYGLKAFSTNTGLNRGVFEHRGVGYHLTGTSLSRVETNGTHTNLGTIPGDSQATFDGINDSIIVVADGVAYQWNETTDTFNTGSDSNFETPQSVAVLNSQALYDGDEDRFVVSDVGAPLTLNALNFAEAEYKADNLERPYAFETIVYMFGSRTIEQWWNPGTGTPPFERIEGGLTNRGLGAVHSIADDGENIYFFGADDQAYSLVGSQETPLLPLSEVREISKFTTKTDAVGWTMLLDGQWFYVLKFKIADRTWIFPRGGQWFELSSGLLRGRYIGDGYMFVYDKHLIANESGDIFELDIDTFDENGSDIKRERTFSPFHSGLFGKPGYEIEITFLVLLGEKGTGLLTGQGSDPVIILQYAPDGETFGNEIWGKAGKLGTRPVILFEINDTLASWTFRLSSTDPVYSNWHAAAVEMELVDL